MRCYFFSLNIIKLSDEFPNKRSAWIIHDQVVRSATSIGANLVEARASSSRREFKKFYEIALKSANETLYWLCLMRDSEYIERTRVKKLLDEATELANMLAKGVMSLKKKNNF